MNQLKVRCIDCENIRELEKAELEGQQTEKYKCKPDGCTKTLAGIFGIRDCSRFQSGENGFRGKLKEPGTPNSQCYRCQNIRKVEYQYAQNTHHENWDCSQGKCTMQFEDIMATKYCNTYKKEIINK